MLYDVAVVHYCQIRVRVLRDLLVIYISTAHSISIACLVFLKRISIHDVRSADSTQSYPPSMTRIQHLMDWCSAFRAQQEFC